MRCACGCGKDAGVYSVTQRGWKKGDPRKYLDGHHRRRTGPEYELRDLGYPTPCWIWLGAVNKGGYGRMSDDLYAHHVYYKRAKGSVPKGIHLDHLCHNADAGCRPGGPCIHRRCVNPDHLEPAPGAANQQRGRSPKLTAEQVRDIRSRPTGYGTSAALAREFGVHPTTIGLIRNHPDRVWKEFFD